VIIFITAFPRILDMTSVKKSKATKYTFPGEKSSLYKNNFLHAEVHLGYSRGI